MIKNGQDSYWIDPGPVSDPAGQQGISGICAAVGRRTKEKTMFAYNTLICSESWEEVQKEPAAVEEFCLSFFFLVHKEDRKAVEEKQNACV